MTKLSRILMFLVCLLTSSTWLTQAHAQAILVNTAPNGLSTTAFRAPSGTSAAMRGVTIVRATELSFLGATNTIQSFGFSLNRAPNASFGGTVNIYMLNTADVTNTKGLDWSVATTGMTQVCTNCAFTVPATAALRYDITLTAPFAYTGGGLYVAYDFTVTLPSPALTIAASYFAEATLLGGTSTYQGTAPASNTLGVSDFRPQFRFGITNPFASDNVVTRIIAPGKMPIGSPSAFNQIKATILSRGTTNTTNLTVTLNVTGVNTFTNTKVITSIIAGEDATVTFDAFTPTITGTNTVTVSVTADGNPNPNNSLSIALETTCSIFSYANNVASLANSGIGFGVGGGLLMNKFKTAVGSGVTVTSVNITISDNAATTGKVISGVLVSATGTVLATSVPYTVLVADLGTVKSFVFSPAIVIPVGNEFLAGIVQSAASVAYNPLASQTIVSPVGFIPAQTNIVSVDTDVLFGGSQPVAGITTLTPQALNVRLMIDVVTTNIIFTNTVAIAGTEGTAYSLDAGATATSGTLTYTVSPTLPAGLSISATTGAISGTPTAVVASTTYTVTASTAGTCSATQSYTFAIVAAPCPTITFANTIATSGTVGTAYSLDASATATSGTLAYAVSPALPTGLSINATTGAISGTPTTVAASATYVVTASTSGTCSNTQSYTFAIVAAPCPTITFTNITVTAATAGTAYTLNAGATTTSGTLSYAVSPTLPAGLSLNTATGAISGTPTSATSSVTYVVTASTSGICSNTQSYTFVVNAAAGCPTITFTNTVATVATAGTAYTLNAGATATAGILAYIVSPALPTGLSINATTGAISGTPTTATASASYIVTASTSGTCSATQTYTFAVDPACPTITFTNTTVISPNAIVGTAYNLVGGATTTSGTITYAVSPALPAGLSINTTTGAISGTPTATTASASYVVTASTSGTCSTTQTYTFAIVCPTITFTNTTVISPNAIVGTAYNLVGGVTTTSGTITYAVSPALPAGLSISTTTGAISGTPTATTASATYVVTVSAFGTCSATQSYTFAVVCPTITFTNTTVISPNAIVGTAYNLVGGATTTSGTITYAVSPALPAGLSIGTTTGAISGTPTAPTASASYVVTASTSGTCSATQTYTFAVVAPPCPTFTVSTAVATAAVVGTAYSLNAAATATSGTLAYTVAPALPAGLVLNPTTGLISGTPTAVTASASYVVTASTSATCSAPKTFTFGVAQNPTTAIDASLSNLVRVSPNPSKGDFNVDFSTINMAKSSIRVYDAQGKTVFTSENNTNLMTISLDKFANGIYLMEVETSKGRILKRLAKQ